MEEESLEGAPPTKKPKTNWEDIPIEKMAQEISNFFENPEETAIKILQQVSKLKMKTVGLLQDYTVSELKKSGIDPSFATAIVKFINKYKPKQENTDPYTISETKQILQDLVTVNSIDVKKRQRVCDRYKFD